MIYILSFTLILLLFASAVISGSETSFFALSPEHIDEFEEQCNEDKTVDRILILRKDTDRFLSTILISNNLVNIAATLVANEILNILLDNSSISSTWTFILKVGVVTFILLLNGEIVPKIMANNYPKKFVLFSANFIYFLSKILFPVSWLLQKLGGSIARHVPTQDINVNRTQLQQAIQITETDSQQDKRILSGIATFSTLEAVEICVPRVDVFAISDDMDYHRLLQLVTEKGFSRIPVYKEDFDHVTGVLYVKDLLPYLDEYDNFKWQKLLRDPYFVPEHKKIDDILSQFRKRKIHFAIVVDEYGGSLGIITMEDILEEIIGDIQDESDKNEVFYKKIDKSTWLFDGKTHIVDFLRVLQLDSDFIDDIKGESDTLAGVMFEIKGQFFKTGDSVSALGITFTANEVDGFKIKTIKVKLENDLL